MPLQMQTYFLTNLESPDPPKQSLALSSSLPGNGSDWII